METLAGILEDEGHEVDLSVTGEAGLEAALEGDFDMLILDVGLPGMDGFQVVGKLREKGVPTPVIMLTALGSEEDIVRGLDAGADGYVTKPYSPRELLARIKALKRRDTLADGTLLSFADLVMDQGNQTVTRNRVPVRLTSTEFKLLAHLLKSRNRPLSKPELLDRIWGIDFDPQTPMLEVHVANLRKKLNAAGPPLIATIRGQGYCLKEGLEG